MSWNAYSSDMPFPFLDDGLRKALLDVQSLVFCLITSPALIFSTTLSLTCLLCSLACDVVCSLMYSNKPLRPSQNKIFIVRLSYTQVESIS